MHEARPFMHSIGQMTGRAVGVASKVTMAIRGLTWVTIAYHDMPWDLQWVAILLPTTFRGGSSVAYYHGGKCHGTCHDNNYGICRGYSIADGNPWGLSWLAIAAHGEPRGFSRFTTDGLPREKQFLCVHGTGCWVAVRRGYGPTIPFIGRHPTLQRSLTDPVFSRVCVWE